jgi:hypothetical protein
MSRFCRRIIVFDCNNFNSIITYLQYILYLRILMDESKTRVNRIEISLFMLYFCKRYGISDFAIRLRAAVYIITIVCTDVNFAFGVYLSILLSRVTKTYP